eukprot:3378200-Prorocentrum_lima.AAC.1
MGAGESGKEIIKSETWYFSFDITTEIKQLVSQTCMHENPYRVWTFAIVPLRYLNLQLVNSIPSSAEEQY